MITLIVLDSGMEFSSSCWFACVCVCEREKRKEREIRDYYDVKRWEEVKKRRDAYMF